MECDRERERERVRREREVRGRRRVGELSFQKVYHIPQTILIK